MLNENSSKLESVSVCFSKCSDFISLYYNYSVLDFMKSFL